MERIISDVCFQAIRATEHEAGKEIASVERGCRSCGSLEAEGCSFCPNCVAKVVDE